MNNSGSSIKKPAQKNGLYLGLFLSGLLVISFLINWDWLMSRWFQPLKLVLVVLVGVLTAYQARKNNREKFSFRNGFSAFFIVVAISLFLYHLVNFLVLDLISPQAGEYLSKMSIDQLSHQLQQAGKSAGTIKAQIDTIKNSDQFSLGNQLKGYIFNLAFFAVLGVVVGFIFKKKKPIIV